MLDFAVIMTEYVLFFVLVLESTIYENLFPYKIAISRNKVVIVRYTNKLL